MPNRIAAAAAVFLLSLTPAGAAHTALLESVLSGKCATVAGGSTTSGADVQQSACTYAGEQRIRFDPAASTAGVFRMRFTHSDKCLEVAGASLVPGANLEQADCDGGTNQQFDLVPAPGEAYEVVARHSGLRVSLASVSSADGVSLVQETDVDGDHQRWRLGNADGRDPSIYGRWSHVIPWPHIPVSAANLPDGRILTFSGSERETWPTTEFTYSATWDPETGVITEVTQAGHNMFCAHLAMTQDGQVFVNGGRNQVNSPWTSLFNYADNQWYAIENMPGGRWYPTTVALTDGDMFTVVGTATNQRNPDRWDAKTGWKVMTGIDFTDPILSYAGTHDEYLWWTLLHVAPQGKLFHSGPLPTVGWINTSGSGSYEDTGIRLTDWYHKHGTSIMYEKGKILNAGGWIAGQNTTSSPRSMTIDLNGPTPVITEIDPMNHARKFHNGVMLPDGEVLVMGGNTSGAKFSDSGAVYAAEIWNPDTGLWRDVGDMTIPRNYHSVGLLLTDGRVLSGGGGYCSGSDYCNGASHPDIEIYSPSYLFTSGGAPAPRPSIDVGPGLIDNGSVFDVQVTGTIDYFSLIKMGATTHGMNTDVRYLRVASQDLGAGTHRLTVDNNPNVLTPGYWMLFAVDTAGVPSEAHVVRVTNLDVQFDNVAPLGGAAQSSTAASAYDVDASSALDGDMTGTEASGSMTLTQVEAEPWWELDLFSVYDINAVRIWNRTDCCTSSLGDFYVLVSDEPFVSTDLATVRAQPGIFEHHVIAEVPGSIDVPVNRTGRFVRVQLANTDALALAEVQVFADPPGAGTPGLVHYDYYTGAFSVVPDFTTLTPDRSGTVDGFHLSPASDATDYAFRFYGRLTLPATGTYTFYLESDDGSRLWIDGTEVVDNDGVHTLQEGSGSIALDAGTHDILVGYFQGSTAPDALTVSYEGPSIAKQAIPPSALALLGAPGGQGAIERAWWTGISGTAVSALTGDPDYPDTPDGVDEPVLFEAPVNWNDNYGTRMRGYLYPPFSGLYRFWISSDDNGQLWLSTDEQPANAVQIAHVPGWSTSREWEKYPEQASAPLFLQGGERYYIEALMKEGGGGDNLAVAWATPFSGREVIAGEYLAPPFEELQIVGVSASPQVVTSPVSVVADVLGDGVTYSWSFGDGTPDTPFAPSAVGQHTYPAAGRYSGNLTVRDAYGNQETRAFSVLVHDALTAGRPRSSSTIVFHDGRAEVWNVNPDNDSVSGIDANTGVLIAEIPVPDEPRSLTVALDGRIWVASKKADSVSVVDPSTQAVVATLPMGRGSAPAGIVGSPALPEVFVTLEHTGDVVRLDAAAPAELDRAFVARDVRGLAVTADGTELLVSRFITPPVPGEETDSPDVSTAGGLVYRVLTADLSSAATVVLQHSDRMASEHTGPGLPNYLQAPVISPDGTGAWVPSKQDNITRGQQRNLLDLTHDQTVRAVSSLIELPAGTENFARRIDHDNASIGSGAAIGPWGLHLYTALEGNREFAISDAKLGTELLRVDVEFAPQGIAVSPTGNYLYVHNFMDRSVSVFDISAVSSSGQLDVIPMATVGTVTAEALPPQILLGKRLFYDARDMRLTSESYMACASCHNEGGGDGRVWDFKDKGEGLRNTLTLEGHGGSLHGLLHWTGNFDEWHDFENQIRDFALGSGLMNEGDYLATQPVLGPPKAGLSPDLDALAAYLESLDDVPVSPHRDPGGVLTAEAEAGRLLFGVQGCDSCHTGPAMTDSPTGLRHDVGTYLPTSGERLGGVLDGFDTPSLVGAWKTPPYLHDGRAATLDAAITAHTPYAGLSQPEIDELVAYLEQVELGDGTAPCSGLDDDCDGEDDDCDGVPDDGFVPTATSCGAGQCAGNVGLLDCVDGTPVDSCDPLLGATAETCDGVDNDCDAAVDEGTDGECDDGIYCNGAEACDAGTCSAGVPITCDDGVSCTVDGCDEAADACVNTPDDGLCGDGQFCNGAESCDPAAGCQAGGDPCAGQFCDEGVDACVECLNDADCGDGLFCNGAETCNAGVCAPGSPVICDDGVACTVDSCDETGDGCLNVPDDAFCGDGQFCNGAEFCDPVGDCQTGAPPCSGGDVCEEETDTCAPAPVPAGAVPDGDFFPGAPVTALEAAGGDLTLTWSPSCLGSDTDYAIYEGVLGDFTSHAEIACSTGGMTTATFSPGPGDRYYLIVPLSANREGHYGNASDGTPRAPGASQCLPQAVGACD